MNPSDGTPAVARQLVLLGLKFNALTLEEAADAIVTAAKKRQKGLVVTPNVDHLVMLQTDADMRSIYQKAAFVFADGMPVIWLSRLTSRSGLPMRVTGADLLPAVCAVAAKAGVSLFFMGGQPGVADRAAQNLRAEFPGLRITGTYCPPMGFEKDPAETLRMVALVNRLQPGILCFGVGAPKQEKWAAAQLDQLAVGPILCIGAAFDFAAGTIKRAPKLVQRFGLEWLWRLSNEPGRLWRRYLLRDSKFLLLAGREILRARTGKSRHT
ncbi:MAG: WecB/TagA/CpsF family glycosyltransferase [Burkholderiales bacterium]|nr:WecB/TagA/CpsF family glycosyltransferase [Burkholderiales bacterium]MDQ3195921.1 WecB/TagA/CpsF family glycosyltransferase [Pseudomonadota bacterium]